MNRGLMQLIVKISDTRNFTKAGKELYMTQPAVSRAVGKLEAELGVKLIARDRCYGVHFTDIGERILGVFKEILTCFERIDQEIAREKGLDTGIVRIGVFPLASSYFIPKIISRITEKYPKIEFTLHEGTIAEIKEMLESREVDVGLIVPSGHHDELITFPLYREEIYTIFKENHPLAAKSVIQAGDLMDQPLIISKADCKPPVMDWFEQAGKKPQIKYVLNNYMTTLNMVQEGLGIGIMSELSTMNLPSNVIVRKLEPKWHREIHLAVSSLKDSSIAVQLFIRMALQLFESRSGSEVNLQ
ncbi:LysR family transcriptional regulator [Paenibacillus cremeus]|uniref:LysR family transcriptional regulator n=1 Tax=Paenibacillus cremeus TaxID=2163881 RepID=A0A559K4V8_9BACL|nr:LysR family transcriptional regulator [Paenibacillus cremeus]TVY07164.1 LysR family transcriptional regulator [Paenibacillus cremeus]